MRLRTRQAYVCTTDGRKAVVAEIRDEGRSGLLRFDDTTGEEWFLWQQLSSERKWHLIDNGGWYIERHDLEGKRAKWSASVAYFSAVEALVSAFKRNNQGEEARVLAPVNATKIELQALEAMGAERL